MNPSKSHIAFFLPALNSGGAEKSFVMLANWFAAKGYKIDVLLVKKEGPYLGGIAPNIRVVELGGQGMVRSLFPLLRYLKEQDPQWIVAGLPGPNIVSIAAKLLLKSRVRILITQHHPFGLNAKNTKTLRRKVRTLIARQSFKYADKIVAVSKGVAEDLSNFIGVNASDICVIHNPLDFDQVVAMSREDVSHSWLTLKEAPVFVSVGRLAPPKDYETLLKALAEVPAARLLILGEGPDKLSVLNMIADLDLSDRVALLGFVVNPYAYIRACDALVLSSKHEGFGNVLIEAMAVNTPVIATDCPAGPAEILQNGRYGTLVPIGDDKALTAAMLAIFKPQDLVERAQDFTLEKIAAQYEELLKE